MSRASTWLLLAALCACGATERAAPGAARDDAGHALESERKFSRIVSLSPATTELLFDLGAGNLLVGRTRYCQDPPEALDIPSVGEGFDPNIEAVLARRPDLVVLYHSAVNSTAASRLRAMGIATVSLRIDRLADLSRAARLLGSALHREARADSLISKLQVQLDSLRAAVNGREKPSVAVVVWDNPPIVIGGGSFLSEIVELAGARNVFADIHQPSATINLETLAYRDPDFLVVFEGAAAADFLKRPEWQAVRAARSSRVVRLSGSEFGHPSFRAPQAAQRLRGLLDAAGR